MSQKPYPTPHIEAAPEDFAKTVLMPGDPLRAKWIAENYLEGPRQVNFRRCAYAYTGDWGGREVTVMASGMGMPSMGIYSYELYNIFGVDTILRIGTAGGISDRVEVRDLVIAQAACTDSAFAAQYNLPGSFAPIGNFGLIERAVELAGRRSTPVHVGNLVTSDHFYNEDETAIARWKKMGVLAAEMETAALYLNAAQAGKRALSICTVSDHFYKKKSLTAAEREQSLGQMIELALDVATYGAVPTNPMSEDAEDPLFVEALRLAVENGAVSTAQLQCGLQIGYGRAAKIIDHMVQRGIVSPPNGQQKQKVLIDLQGYRDLFSELDRADF